MVNGVQQSPYEGTSMLYSFNDAKAPERHETQYFEMFCNRGIYHKGWSAVTKHRTPWDDGRREDAGVRRRRVGALRRQQGLDAGERPVEEDAGEAARAAAAVADRSGQVQRAAARRPADRAHQFRSGRPAGAGQGQPQLLFAGMGRLSENSVVNIKNKSFAVTADLDVPAKGAEGVIIAQGGRFGGWSLYAKGGKAKFVYNVLGIKSFAIEGTKPIPAGKTQVRMEFAYDGGGMGKGGTVTLYCDGKEVGKGRVEQTQGFIFSADETTDIGYESGTTVSPDYTAHTSRFNGKINWVQIDLGKDAEDADHYISRGGAAARRDGAAVGEGHGAAPAGRRRPSLSSEQDLDALPNLITNLADAFDGLALGIFERPVVAPQSRERRGTGRRSPS